MDSTKKHKVEILYATIGPETLTHGIYVNENESLLDNFLKCKVEIDHSCGGHGTCGTCHFFILEGKSDVSPPEQVEQDLRSDRGFEDNERLACQTYARGDIKIKIR